MKKQRMRNKKKFDDMEDFRFANSLSKNPCSIDILQGEIRTIIKRYGWNPAMYPEHTRYLFWTLISGDSWGSFKKKLREWNKKHERPLDARDPKVVYYYC